MTQKQLQTVQHFYSNAQPIEHMFQKVKNTATDDLGIQPSKMVYADSFCSDELNSIEFPWNENFSPFRLGGLGGYPFGGLTGMGAFAAHIPARGIAIIFYGPHIGITNDGTVGKINRRGQEMMTGCCGSVTAAVEKLLNGNIREGAVDEDDYQQNKIEQILLSEKARIQRADQNILEAVEVAYEAIADRIEQLLNQTPFPCQNLIKAGGIYINGDNNKTAFWASRKFDVSNS